jgi:PAS domain S-box-containing protein
MRLRLLLIIMCLAISLIPVAMISGLQGFQIASAFLGLILMITLMVSYGISYFITHPLVKLTRNIDEISKGNLDVELEESEIYEINNLTASLDRVMASLKLAIHKAGLKKEEIFEEVIQAKEEAEKKFENVLRKIDGWIWEADEKGVCTICSAKVTEALGYSPEQIIGTEINRFLPGEEAKKLSTTIAQLSKTKTETPRQVDLFWSYQEDGHPVWVRTYLIPVFDHAGHFRGVRCFSRDITEVHTMHDRIQDLQSKLEYFNTQMNDLLREPLKENLIHDSIVDLTNGQEYDYLFIFDEDTKIVDCTTDTQKKLGYSKQEMMTLTLKDIMYLDSPKEIQASLLEIKNRGEIQKKTIHKKKDGSSIFVSEHIRYLKDRNMFICMVKEDVM